MTMKDGWLSVRRPRKNWTDHVSPDLKSTGKAWDETEKTGVEV